MKPGSSEACGATSSAVTRRPTASYVWPARALALLPATILTLSFLLLAALFLLGNRPAYHAILWQLGFNPFDFPFLDAHGVLATAECFRQGIDVIARNPCDALGRTLDYSPFWLITAKLGLRTTFTMQAGVTLDVLFLASVFFLPAMRSWAAAAAMTAALLSSAVALGLERANLDLGVFVIGLIAAGFVAIEGVEVARALKNIESGSRFSINFGAANLPIVLGAIFASNSDRTIAVLELCGLFFAAYGALLLMRRDDFRTAVRELEPRRRALMLLGSALIVGCFFAAQNAPYRGIYFLFVMPGLTEMWRAPVSAAMRRRAILITVGTIFLLWGQFFQRGLGQALLASRLPTGLANAIQLVFWVAREAVWWWIIAALLAFLLALLQESPFSRRLWGLAGSFAKPAKVAAPSRGGERSIE